MKAAWGVFDETEDDKVHVAPTLDWILRAPHALTVNCCCQPRVEQNGTRTRDLVIHEMIQ